GGDGGACGGADGETSRADDTGGGNTGIACTAAELTGSSSAIVVSKAPSLNNSVPCIGTETAAGGFSAARLARSSVGACDFSGRLTNSLGIGVSRRVTKSLSEKAGASIRVAKSPVG